MSLHVFEDWWSDGGGGGSSAFVQQTCLDSLWDPTLHSAAAMHIPSLSFLFYSPQPSLFSMHATLLLIFLFICPAFLSLHSFQMVIWTVGVCHTRQKGNTLLGLLTFHVSLLSTFHSETFTLTLSSLLLLYFSASSCTTAKWQPLNSIFPSFSLLNVFSLLTDCHTPPSFALNLQLHSIWKIMRSSFSLQIYHKPKWVKGFHWNDPTGYTNRHASTSSLLSMKGEGYIATKQRDRV